MQELIKSKAQDHAWFLKLRYEFIDDLFDRLRTAAVVEDVLMGKGTEFYFTLNSRYDYPFNIINVTIDKGNISEIIITPNVPISDAKFIITINFTPEEQLFYMSCELIRGVNKSDKPEEYQPFPIAIEIKHICLDILTKWHWKMNPPVKVVEKAAFKPEIYFIVGKEDF